MKEFKHNKNIEQNTIIRARQAHLAEYLISIGEPLERAGSRYRHKEHDSLTFTDNSYYWNSRGEHGNAIDYLMRHKDMDFKTALLELNNTIPVADECEDEQISEQFYISDIKFENDLRRAIAYLSKTRGIGYELIKKLITDKLIFQESQDLTNEKGEFYQAHNIVFPIYDEKNNIVGAETQGTLTHKRFKGLKTGSKYGYGYNINPTNSNTVKFMLFFESAVDLLSFWDIKNAENKILNDCLLISMAGLKENIVKHMLGVAKHSVQPFLCVDNDPAGVNFIKAIKEHIECVKTHSPDAKYKDWNEQLKAMKK